MKIVFAARVPDSTFRTCGFGGCTSFASHVLCADDEALVYCCAQCAAVGVRAHREAANNGPAFMAFRNRVTIAGFVAKKTRGSLVADYLSSVLQRRGIGL